MEPNIDRSMWGVIVLIIAVVVGVLAKDKIYDAVSGIFEKHSEAIDGLDIGGLNSMESEDALDIDPITQSKFQITTNLLSYGFSKEDVAHAEAMIATTLAAETGYESQKNYVIYPKGESIVLNETQLKKIKVTEEVNEYLSTKKSNLPKGTVIDNVLRFEDSHWNHEKKVSNFYEYDFSDITVSLNQFSHLLNVNGVKKETIAGSSLTINEDDSIKLITAPWITTISELNVNTIEHQVSGYSTFHRETIKEGLKFNEMDFNSFTNITNDKSEIKEGTLYGYDYYFKHLETGETYQPTDTIPTDVKPEYQVLVTLTKFKIFVPLTQNLLNLQSSNQLYKNSNNYHFVQRQKSITYHDVKIRDTVVLDVMFGMEIEPGSTGITQHIHEAFEIERFDTITGEIISKRRLEIGDSYTVRNDERIRALYSTSFMPYQH